MSGQLNLFDDTGGSSHSLPVGEQTLEPILLDKDRYYLPDQLVGPDSLRYLTQDYEINGNLLGRLLRELHNNEKTQSKITRKDLSSLLTIPLKRVEGLTAISNKAELLTKKIVVTPFGNLIVDYDPYFLNIGSLWFLHFIMSSNAKIIFWSRLFNSISYQSGLIVQNEVMNYFSDVVDRKNEKVMMSRGWSELRNILLTYSDYIFKPLGLIVRFENRKFAIITDEFQIPPLIWLASILAYRDRYYPGAVTLETRLLVDANFSPGRLFRQNEAQVRKVLDRMHSLGLLTVERNLGLDQVRFKSEFTWLGAVAAHLREGK